MSIDYAIKTLNDVESSSYVEYIKSMSEDNQMEMLKKIDLLKDYEKKEFIKI